MIKVSDLVTELITVLGDDEVAFPELKDSMFSVFDVDELLNYVGNVVDLPIGGVSYEGNTRQENSVQGQRNHTSGALLTHYFTVTIAVNYHYGTPEDNKQFVTDLMDRIKPVVLGLVEGGRVNTRPWRFSGETPLKTDQEGIIVYAQMWETDLLVIGN